MRKKIYTVLILLILAGASTVIFSSCTNDAAPTAPLADVTVQITDNAIKHVYITDFYPGTNFNNDDDFAAVAWVATKTGYIGRTIFKFDLSVIPQNATITNAQFLLDYNQAPFHYTGAGHHQDSGSNACYMQRITQNWIDTSVTWNNQPGVTQTDQISLDSSTSNFQNYSIDMTAAITDMVKNPSANYGFLFRLKKESPLRVLGFSSGLRNSNLKPVLQITYKPAQ